MEELIFKVTKEELKKFLDLVKELVKIDDNFKILFLEKGVLVYTILGEQSKINALKIFPFKTSELFSEFPEDLFLNITLMDGKKFHDKMNFLLDTDDETIDIIIHYNKDKFAYSFGGKNTLLEVRATCQMSNNIKDLTFEIIKERLNSDYCDWKFDMKNDDLSKVLRLNKLDSEKELITIRIEKDDVIFSDNQWDLKVNKTDYGKEGTWNIRKEYLKYIVNDTAKDSFEISVFPSYMVVNETKSYFLFSMDLVD
jgi:hypothetical protein